MIGLDYNKHITSELDKIQKEHRVESSEDITSEIQKVTEKLEDLFYKMYMQEDSKTNLMDRYRLFKDSFYVVGDEDLGNEVLIKDLREKKGEFSGDIQGELEKLEKEGLILKDGSSGGNDTLVLDSE